MSTGAQGGSSTAGDEEMEEHVEMEEESTRPSNGEGEFGSSLRESLDTTLDHV